MKRDAKKQGKQDAFYAGQGLIPGRMVRYVPDFAVWPKKLKKKIRVAVRKNYYSVRFVERVSETLGRVKWLEQGPFAGLIKGGLTCERLETLRVATPLPGSDVALSGAVLQYEALIQPDVEEYGQIVIELSPYVSEEEDDRVFVAPKSLDFDIEVEV